MRLSFDRRVNLSKLHDELLAARLRPTCVEGDEGTVWLSFDGEVDKQLVERLVVEHDPTPAPAAPDPKLAIAAATTVEELKQAVLKLIDPPRPTRGG